MKAADAIRAHLCPLCNKPASVSSHTFDYFVDCSRCGKYQIGLKLTHIWPDGEDLSQIHLFSGYTRELSELAQSSPQPGPPLWAQLTDDSLPSIRRHFPKGIRDKSRKLLAAMWRQSKYFGQLVMAPWDTACPLGYAVNPDELRALARLLGSSGLIENLSFTSSGFTAGLAAAGIDEVERLQRSNVDSAKAFVAMSFAPQLRVLFDGPLSAAIEAAGFRPVRMDCKDHNNQIVDEMLGEIRESRFIVADFTQQKHGVYFEAGFAMGLGLPVIWLVHKEDLPKCHFDTRQFNYLEWTSGDDLARRLYNRIRATIGHGPLEVTGEARAAVGAPTPAIEWRGPA